MCRFCSVRQSYLYLAFLQRAPDGLGLSHWINNTNLYGRPATLDAFKLAGEYSELAGTLYRETFWLIPDHLGTPRMVAHRTGSLAGVKRHDLAASVGEDRVGLAGWVVDRVLGSEAEVDEEAAREAIASLCGLGLVTLTPGRRLAASPEGREAWLLRRPG